MILCHLKNISGNRSIKNLSLFFDDNITGEELDIVRPCEITGKDIPSKALYGQLIFRVNTKEAMVNDNYYVDHVLKAIEILKQYH